jgi:hypothetical protein
VPDYNSNRSNTGQPLLWKNFPYFSNLQQAFSQLNKELPPLSICEQIKDHIIDLDTLKAEKDINDAATCLYQASFSSLKPDSTRAHLLQLQSLYRRLLTIDPLNKTYLSIFRGNMFNLFKLDSDYTALCSNYNEVIKSGEQIYAAAENKTLKSYQSFVSQLSSDYGNLSYYTFFDTTKKDYANALKYATRGLELDSTNSYIRTNVALAYLLSGQFKTAEDYYLKYKDVWYHDHSKQYKTSFRIDFVTLKQHKIINQNTEAQKSIYLEAQKIDALLSDSPAAAPH